MLPPSRPPVSPVSPSPRLSITVCHNNTPNVIIVRQVYKVFVISSFKKGSRISTKNKNVLALFVNTGVETMEICPAMNKTCLFSKDKSCTADYKMSCIEALTMTAMIEND